jgi:hypothetical protein
MAGNNLSSLISRELELYRLLIGEQKRKIGLYLKADLDLVRISIEKDKKFLEEIRYLNSQVRSELGGRVFSEVTLEMDLSESRALQLQIEELRRLTSELSRINLQNYRYAQSSFCFTRAMLGEIFSQNSNYNQNGYLQTGQTAVEF